MGLARKGVESLWDSPERQERAHEIVRRLLARDAQGAQQLLDKVDGRWDLRGFDFALQIGERPFKQYDEMGYPRPGRGNQFQGLVLENIDFSHSTFVNTNWMDCEFQDCLFSNADFVHSRFWGCTFKRVRFAESDVSGFTFGATEKGLGVFQDVEFENGEFTQNSFPDSRLERCRFKCNLSRVDFGASQLYDCSFEGRMNMVYFWGQARPAIAEDRTIGRDVPINPMKNVDFSKAKFKEVIFKGPIDLSECKFPKDVVFIPDIKRVFPEVIRRIEAEWSSPDKEKGIEEATNYMTNKRDYPIGQAVLIPYRKEYLGKEFAQKFISVVREVVDALAAEGRA